MTTRIIFIDLNSYFASVEQAENPSLLGKPVAVVPMLADTASCLAASYPAKAKGIRTGTLVRDARRLCPNIIFVEADHRKYVEYHHKIIEAVERCLPVWKVYSIDEMAIRLFGREQSVAFARAKALDIKRSIAERIHPSLTCSIGIAPNRYLAKIASDMQKPDGLVVLQAQELPERLYSLHLRDFPGIGPQMEQRLMQARCPSAKLLCQSSISELRELWGGKRGEDFWHLIRGEELEERDSPRGSISHSRVLSPETRTAEHAWPNLVALLSKAAMRLREEQFYTKTLHLNVKLLGRRLDPDRRDSDTSADYWDKGVRFDETQDSNLLLDKLKVLWMDAPKERLLRVGVVLGGLVPSNRHQLSLFENVRHAQLMQTLDRLNSKIRKNIVVFGASRDLKRASHAPIAFGHIPSMHE